ncbi:MAG: formylglycine-generating enzyme family protein [Leptothrix ochracea]|uniref:formylglycine-generating enzyme family protein n=2 Tax=Leptothrix ochracea TaxID=735331 RepID=UPI0034E2BF28
MKVQTMKTMLLHHHAWGRLLSGVVLGLMCAQPSWADPSGTPPLGAVFHDCALCPQMVVVPAGSYLMGSAETELGREIYESPQHRVMILKPFAVGRFEVTRDEWQICVAEGPCQAQSSRTGMGAAMIPGAGRLPVVDITWEQASQYAQWLRERTGQPYRLLSESEWEYVARAGSQSAYAGGDTFVAGRANVSPAMTESDAVPAAWHVGSFAPNAFGLYDLQGNVWEWVQDCFHDNLAGAPADGAAWTERCSHAESHMARGGSWKTPSVQTRPAHRAWAHGSEADIGFRVARALTP